LYNKLRKLEEDVGKLLGLYNAIKSEKITVGEGIEITVDGSVKVAAKKKALEILGEIEQIVAEIKAKLEA